MYIVSLFADRRLRHHGAAISPVPSDNCVHMISTYRKQCCDFGFWHAKRHKCADFFSLCGPARDDFLDFVAHVTPRLINV
ncbi:hypothetical protein A4249_01800 [Brevundimonas sp. GW460-12-10-14-LB2]|nr:hypothetical protein A4249_01800 [Brevundimonas sp. GW460-12-10-14-LB2]